MFLVIKLKEETLISPLTRERDPIWEPAAIV